MYPGFYPGQDVLNLFLFDKKEILLNLNKKYLKNKRFSKKFFAYLDWLEASQYWSAQEIYDYKSTELQKMYQHAYTTVPFYRDKYKKAGLSLGSIQDLEDTHKIPILEKTEIRDHWKNMVSTKNPDGKLYPRHTSGSSGMALDFYAS